MTFASFCHLLAGNTDAATSGDSIGDGDGMRLNIAIAGSVSRVDFGGDTSTHLTDGVRTRSICEKQNEKQSERAKNNLKHHQPKTVDKKRAN